MKLLPNPRGRVKNWKSLMRKVEARRKEGLSLEVACAEIGIAYSTYHEWKKRSGPGIRLR